MAAAATAVFAPLAGAKCTWPSKSRELHLGSAECQSRPLAPAHRLASCRSAGVLRCCAASDGSRHPSTSGTCTEDGGAEEKTDQDRGVTQPQRQSGRPRTPESTDWIASSLTRRFGLGAGLAWVGFLAFGVISEQIKTRTEVFLEEQGTR